MILVRRQTKRGQDVWDSAHFLGPVLNDSSFPFRELVLPSCTPKGHNAGR